MSTPAGLTGNPSAKGVKKKAFTGFGVAMLFVLAFAIFFFLNFKTVVVSGVSMLPTLKNGRKVLVSKAYWLLGPINHKDVVVLRDTGPTGYIIKRVIYMPGEEVDWKNTPKQHRLANGRFRVPAGHVFVMGDNRDQSEDSREFGPVPFEEIIGKVLVLP